MSTPKSPHSPAASRPSPAAGDGLSTIDPRQLAHVAGGASRVSTRSGGANDQITAMLTQVTDSIKELSKSQSSGMDPTMMMMMMMMMGGGGGGGGGQAVAAAPQQAPAPQQPVINITTNVRRRY
jgi:hypothetical protein